MTSKKATNEILNFVNDIVKTHPSGEAFFDELDERLKNASNLWITKSAIRLIPNGHTLILSGGMGLKIANYIDNGDLPKRSYILFKGGLRKGGTPHLIRTSGNSLESKPSTFLDDSIYAGATFFAIQKFIKEHTKYTTPKKVVAIYDGCPEKRPFVKSLFRYYDFFQATPNFKF